jgi:hypothetical protein
MALSNAERHARWRQRRQDRFAGIESDWALLQKAVSFPIKKLQEQGRTNMATVSPGAVTLAAVTLKRIIARWPHLSVEDKGKLAKGVAVSQLDDEGWREIK